MDRGRTRMHSRVWAAAQRVLRGTAVLTLTLSSVVDTATAPDALCSLAPALTVAAIDHWTNSTSMCLSRYGHGVTTGADGRIHAVGGATTGDRHVATAEAFDTARGTWSAIAPLPTARIPGSADDDGK